MTHAVTLRVWWSFVLANLCSPSLSPSLALDFFLRPPVHLSLSISSPSSFSLSRPGRTALPANRPSVPKLLPHLPPPPSLQLKVKRYSETLQQRRARNSEGKRSTISFRQTVKLCRMNLSETSGRRIGNMCGMEDQIDGHMRCRMRHRGMQDVTKACNRSRVGLPS